MNGAARILLLIDQPSEAERLKQIFADAAADCGAHLVQSEKEALAALEAKDFEMVFVDLRAGPLVAAQVLHNVWKLRPKTARFLLASSLDADVMVTCVLGAHHFLPKPLTVQSLTTAIARADAMNKLVRNERIQSLVSRMRTLPSRPSLYLEIMRELRSPTASANAVGELVSRDLAISTKLIQVVNSAFYGLAQQITDPAAAVLLLGLETTSALVLSIEAFARFDKVKPLYFSMDRVWKHSQTVAQSAKSIAELMSNDPDVARNAYTAGLLHDIGKLALALNFEEQYHGALKLAEKQKLPPCDVEAEVFGATHADAGAYLLSLWGLPLPIVEAVASHHAPAGSFTSPFSAATALHLAERLHYAEDLALNNIKGVEIDLDYRAELEIGGRLEEFRRIVRGDEPSDGESESRSEGTMIYTREQLKAAPTAIPSSGEPAPLIEVTPAAESVQGPSKKIIFSAISLTAVILACAISYVFTAQNKKQEIARKLQLAEEAANPSDARVLSNRLVESSERIVTQAPPGVPTVEPQEDPISNLKLQAIIYNGLRSSMVINGRSFRLGDEIAGARIVAVQHNEVTLERAGLQRILKLP